MAPSGRAPPSLPGGCLRAARLGSDGARREGRAAHCVMHVEAQVTASGPEGISNDRQLGSVHHAWAGGLSRKMLLVCASAGVQGAAYGCGVPTVHVARTPGVCRRETGAAGRHSRALAAESAT